MLTMTDLFAGAGGTSTGAASVPADQLTRDDLAAAGLQRRRARVECFACGHTETGYAHHPHDAMTDHYLACLHRAKPCGCHLDGPDRTDVWTCDDHASAYLRERTAWRIANHEARRWTPLRDEPEQLALDFTEHTA